MVSTIDKEDVLNIAQSINKELTEKQVNKVLHLYQHEEECDTTATWDLIVENCIYQVLNEN